MSASEPNSSVPSPMVIETPQVPETPGRGAAAERRKWPQHSSEPAGLSVDCPPAISTPLSGERRSSVGELLDVESRQSCNRNRSPQGAPHGLRQAGAPPGMGLTIECSPRLSRRAPAAPGPRRTALALTPVRCLRAQPAHPEPELGDRREPRERARGDPGGLVEGRDPAGVLVLRRPHDGGRHGQTHDLEGATPAAEAPAPNLSYCWPSLLDTPH